MNASLVTLFTNLEQSFPGFFRLAFAGFWLCGLAFFVWGINNVRYASEGRGDRGNVNASIVSILIGAVLMYMPTALESMATTVFATSAGPVGMMDYQTPDAAGGNVFVSVRTFLQLVGVYFFGRGLITMRHIGIKGEDGRHTFYGAVVRLVFGIALVHIIDTLQVISKTVGLGVVNTWLSNMNG